MTAKKAVAKKRETLVQFPKQNMSILVDHPKAVLALNELPMKEWMEFVAAVAKEDKARTEELRQYVMTDTDLSTVASGGEELPVFCVQGDSLEFFRVISAEEKDVWVGPHRYPESDSIRYTEERAKNVFGPAKGRVEKKRILLLTIGE